MSQPNKENTIDEQFSNRQDCLKYWVESTMLPTDGYKRAGRKLFTALNTKGQGTQKRAKMVEKWLARPNIILGLATAYIIIAALLLIVTPLSRWLLTGIITIAAVPADWTIEVLLYGFLIGVIILVLLFIGMYLVARQTVELLKRWIASTKPQMAVQLGFGGEPTQTQVTITTSAEIDSGQVQASFQELGAPCRLQDETTTTADLLSIPAEELTVQNLHIAEWTLKEHDSDVALTTQEETLLTGTESTTLPLDEITQYCRGTEEHCVVQAVVVPRRADDRRTDAEMKTIEYGTAPNRHLRSLYTLFDVIMPESNGSRGKRTREEMSNTDRRKYDGLDRADSAYTFSVRIRAVVYDSQSSYSEHALPVFDVVEDAFELATNDRITLKREVPTSDAAKRDLLDRFANEIHTPTPTINNVTSLRAWKRVLGWRTNMTSIADSAQIWNYCLLSTESGDGLNWDHDATPRDQQPTDLPAEDKLDQFRVDDSNDTEW